MQNAMTSTFVVFLALVSPGFAGAPRAMGGRGKESALEAMRGRIEELRETVESVRRRKNRQLESLRSEIADLKRRREDNWLSKRRTEAVERIVRDAVADAERRASFRDGAVTAGHDGSHFFLRSPDKRFYLELAGHLQVRYTFNSRRNSGGDDDQGGFNLRRIKFKPEGWVTYNGHKILFDISLAGDQDAGGGPIFEDYTVGYAFTENLSVKAGRFKQPFALQNRRSSSRQLAVERDPVVETFNVDFAEGVELTHEGERFVAALAVHDGATQTDFDQDRTDFAVTGRGQYLVLGRGFDAFDDASAWSGDPVALMLGGGVDYQAGESGTAATPPDVLRWTGDLSFEARRLGIMLAWFGAHTGGNEAGAGDFDDFGFMAQAGYMVVPDTLEPFVRYGLVLPDEDRPDVAAGNSEEATTILTAGFNWYHAGHDAKFSMDAVYGLDPLRGIVDTSSSRGLQTDAPGEDGQLAIRAEYQLKF